MTTNEENMSNALTTLTRTLATKLDMGDGEGLIETLKATAFKGEVTDAQMTALLVVANQYGLNPWTKEIYAFPDKNNGIVPVVGVDGWSRIINSHPQFDGIEFHHADKLVTMPGGKPAPEWIECHIYRKDRSRPIVVREYMDEVYRAPFKGKYGEVTGPWQTHTKRFLRHKSMIQCARLAFGYGGIYDQDEAERIVDATEKHMGPAEVVPQAPAHYPAAEFNKNLPAWRRAIEAGKKTADNLIAMVETKGSLTDEQKAALRAIKPPQPDVQDVQPKDEAPAFTYAQVADKLTAATDVEQLAEAGSLIGAVVNADHRTELVTLYEQRSAEMEAA